MGDIRRFHGLESFYRRFVPNFSTLTLSLIDDVVDIVDICTNLLYDFYDFDLGSLDCTCDDFDESTVVCSICAEISSTIHLIMMRVQVLILLFLFHQPSISLCLPQFNHLPLS